MEQLLTASVASLTVALVTICLLIAGHTLHIAALVGRRGVPHKAWVFAYELMILTFLVVLAATAYAAASGSLEVVMLLPGLRIPLEPLLWGNVAVVGLGVWLLVTTRRRILALEALVLLACTPLALHLAGAYALWIFAATFAFYVFRVLSTLLIDVRQLADDVAHFSTGDAVMRMPDGVLIAETSGRILVMNNVMRCCLSAYSLATDLSEIRGLWDALREQSNAEGHAPIGDGALLTMPEGTVRLFTKDALTIDGRECERLLAIDVTEEHRLNHALVEENERLTLAAGKLRVIYPISPAE